MLQKIKRTLVAIDDLLEVLVLHILFSKKNWKTTCSVLALTGLLVVGWPRHAPMGPASYAHRGYQELIRGEISKSIQDLGLAARLAPTQAVYHQLLGLAYLEKNQNDLALDSLHKALALAPSRKTLFFLGCAYQNLKLNETAIGCFREMEVHDSKGLLASESAAGYEALAEAKIGESLIHMGEFNRAMLQLRRAIALYPSSPHAYFYLGVAYWEQGNPDLGVEQFFHVLQLTNQEPAAVYNVACYYSLKGQSSLALLWLRKSFEAGFNQFKHMETDHDLDSIRHLPAYKRLVAEWKTKLPHED